eukprot:gnl/MRDRNA2_/MRDRNA2_60510_c0_seq1.p1 gnl/MRDRNA2_/MRDRNA2_60510_c0~~gnl/MRDRNA2_/MRDRNA2_60510_c0_seq1.p1  ORF type:complete len:429 (+),score=95.41 gnl/MRDRNA2_/MRDRNA2_60510_c0_seq1:53-1339(+)
MATAEGTRRFLQRCVSAGRLNKVHVRPLGQTGLQCAAIGYGAYRVGGGDSEAAHAATIREAIQKAGINMLDTSSHYSAAKEGKDIHGASEAMIGRTLREMVTEGIVERDEIVLCTKVGHVDVAQEPPEGAVRLAANADFWHSIEPNFVDAEVRASASRLGTSPDFVMLHNPEYFLTDQLLSRVAIADAWDEMYDRLRATFEALEKLCDEGVISSGYGVSGNFLSCYFSTSGRGNTYEALHLERVVEAAAAAAGGGEHRMKLIQLPLNAIENGAILGRENIMAEASQGDCSLAAQLGLGVVVNRPLNAIPVPGMQSGDWGRHEQHIRLKDTKPMPPTQALLRRVIIEALQEGGGLPEGSSENLQILSLRLASCAPCVDVCLNGMRTSRYVSDAAAALQEGLLPADAALNAFNKVRMACQEMGGQKRGLW